jgi:DNA polymerase III epsilon subunit-like protein
MRGASSRDPAVFVGYNATFDWSFVNDMFYRTGIHSPFGYKALDLRALVMGALRMPWLEINQEAFLPRLNLPPLSSDLAHNALEDARHQGRILCRLLEYLEMDQAITWHS